MRARELIGEKWSAKYKRSIDCSHPKGFSQRAHCAGRKKTDEDAEHQKHDRVDYVIYVNDKAATVYDTEAEARRDLDAVREKYPEDKIVLKRRRITQHHDDIGEDVSSTPGGVSANTKMVCEKVAIGQSTIRGAGRGIFATEPIKAGDTIILSPLKIISSEDWEKIKNTKFARMMGLQWTNGRHALPMGEIDYTPYLTPNDRAAFQQTALSDRLTVSPFLLANHSTVPNAEEFYDLDGQKVGLRALRFIDPDEEILKKYRGDPNMKSR